MSQAEVSFSTRHGYSRPNGILYRGEIPVPLRLSLLEILQWYADPTFLWQRIGKLFTGRAVDKLLRTAPSIPGDPAEHGSLRKVRNFLVSCPWYYLYDLIEDLFSQLSSREVQGPEAGAEAFQRDINEYFVSSGIGWKFSGGKIVMRGEESLESAVQTAVTALGKNERTTAAAHIQDAMQELSRRPEPNLRDAVVHAVEALECTARDLVGDPKTSLEEILRLHPSLLPGAVGKAVSELWGYAKRQGHVWGRADRRAWYLDEGREPAQDEVEMIVGLVSIIAVYLGRKPRIESLL
jgi:hypothetical protein